MLRAQVGRYEVWVPETRSERRRGLLRRTTLAPQEGLLLRRCRSVHTVGMRFPIDAVLLDRGWRVVEVVRLVPGRVLLPRPRVHHVLEVVAGTGPRPGQDLGPPEPIERARAEPGS